MPLTDLDKSYLESRFREVKSDFRAVIAEHELIQVRNLSDAIASHKRNCGAHVAYRKVKIWMLLALFAGGGLIVALIKWIPIIFREGVKP